MNCSRSCARIIAQYCDTGEGASSPATRSASTLLPRGGVMTGPWTELTMSSGCVTVLPSGCRMRMLSLRCSKARGTPSHR